ncbi:MAG: VanZ family protein [Terriglobales bacterium]
MRSTTKHVLRSWAPVVLWTGLIALESTDTLSSAHTGKFLYSIAATLFGHVDPHLLELINAVLRKVGHFIGYAVLSLLFLRALHLSFSFGETSIRALRRWALIAITLTVAVAALDEFHQSFLPSRTGVVRDVVLDMFGALCMQATVLLILRLRRSRAPQHKAQAAD